MLGFVIWMFLGQKVGQEDISAFGVVPRILVK